MKRFLCIVLALAMVLGCCSFAFAASKSEKQAADALNNLDLFQGVSTTKLDYALDRSLTRGEGYILLIRLLGQDAAAKACNYVCPFTDAKGTFYERYAAYAYATGLTKGIGNNKFGATLAMSEQMFATVCLRSLGYSEDSGDFTYSKAIATAKAKGLPVGGVGSFDRGNAVSMMWQTLNTTMKNSRATLAGELIAKGVFSENALEVSKKVEAGTLAYVKGGAGFGPGVSNGVVAKPSSKKSVSEAKADLEEALRKLREAEEAQKAAEEAAKKALEEDEKNPSEETHQKVEETEQKLEETTEEVKEAEEVVEEKEKELEEAEAAEETTEKVEEEAGNTEDPQEPEEEKKEETRKGTDQKSEFETPLMPL